METGATASGAATARALAPEQALARYARFDQVVDLIRANRDGKLQHDVECDLRLVSYSPGRIEFQPTERAPRDLAQRLGTSLQRWTGVRWAISVVDSGGGKTIDEQTNAKDIALKEEAKQHPLVQAVFDAFPDAKITEIRTLDDIAAEARAEALPEVDEEWDPFEDG